LAKLGSTEKKLTKKYIRLIPGAEEDWSGSVDPDVVRHSVLVLSTRSRRILVILRIPQTGQSKIHSRFSFFSELHLW
jgi:hypothetical protein